MKDTIITGRRKRIELWTLLTCFALAQGVNLYAILTCQTSWSELLTSLGYVTLFALVLYALWSLLRLLACLLLRLLHLIH